MGQGLRDGLVIGTGSAGDKNKYNGCLRENLKAFGNVDTRIRKMEEGQYDSSYWQWLD